MLYLKERDLVRKEFLFSDYDIIVVSHPLCHFSNDARSFIKNSKYRAVFESASLWVIPPSGSMYIEKVFNVNKDSSLPFEYFYVMNEWPEIERWDTPSFYFYSNGLLVYTFSGWPEEGNIDKLEEGLLSIGVDID